jgi:hypothetical protein
MKEPKDLLFPKGFSEVDNLKKKEMQRPKLKKEKELTPIELFNNKLGKLFKINTEVSEEKKRKIGIIITTIIILTIVISAYYFLIFEPTQQALNEAKTSKLNELHTYYKGPLASAGSVFKIEDEINNARSVGEVESIVIIPQATKDWKNHHLKSIKMNTDNFNRTMAVYENNGKNVIMPVNDAIAIVNDNDARKLCEISFKKPNTVSVPILVSRLQAGAGLISVGSIVDIYKNNNGTLNQTDMNKTEADVSGCTVLSIMRYEENGEIESQYTKGNTIVQGENTNPNENSQTFTSNVLELLKGSIIQGYDEKTTMDMLRNYGVKLSNYEREINLGDLDAEYMILIEVPQEKVNFVIDNMDEIVLTIPTANAPTWMAGQLNSTYTIG